MNGRGSTADSEGFCHKDNEFRFGFGWECPVSSGHHWNLVSHSGRKHRIAPDVDLDLGRGFGLDNCGDNYNRDPKNNSNQPHLGENRSSGQ